MRRGWVRSTLGVLALALLAAVAVVWFDRLGTSLPAGTPPGSSATAPVAATSAVPGSSAPTMGTTGEEPPPPDDRPGDGGVEEPMEEPAVRGLLTFRGNATRTFYGAGPVPREPVVLWWYPDAPMCSLSKEFDEEFEWCGTGWTGQPAVVEHDGTTLVVFGAYDARVHFLDGATGERALPSFTTGDLVKGSVTIDPDGYPLAYVGSRDGYLRVLAFDRDQPVELWRLWAYDASPTLWNDDWDSSPLILDDYMLIGGENSVFHVVRLHRGYDSDGWATVAPELVFHAPGWDEELVSAVGYEVSIESSVAVWEGVAYFANSGGLVQGWDISGLAQGHAPQRVFRYWTGDDTDATVVVDEHGHLYVGVEYERGTARSRAVGQILKLDPRRDDPLVWSVHDRDEVPAGVWGTPALHRDLVIVPTHGGVLLGLDRETGGERWRLQLEGPTWSSPAVVDDILLMGDCGGYLYAFDVSDTSVAPVELWWLSLGGCIESTPAVWGGRIYVGTRDGYFYGIGEP